MARILGVCVLIMLACVFWKAQGDDSCEMRDMGKAVALIVQVKNNVEILQKTVTSQQKTIQKMKIIEETMKKREEEMERTMETMKQKEEEVERTTETVKQTMETMKQKEEEMERTTETVKQTMETMKQKEEEMERTTETVKQTMEAMKQKEEEMERTTETVKQTMETMKQKEEEMERTIDALKNSYAMVGFSVNVPKNVSGGVMTFSTTVTNVGNGYDMDTGIFTCTTPGMFYFSVSLLKKWGHYNSAQCYIRKNADNLVHAYTRPSHLHDSSTAAVASVLVHLAVGDKVKLAGCSAIHKFHGGNYAMFSGFLVAPDA